MKGHEASELFFASLEKNDKTLYKNLKIASRLEALLPTETATSPGSMKTKCDSKHHLLMSEFIL